MSTCFNKDTRDIIYCAYTLASYLSFVIYLFVLAYLLLIIHLFCALFDYLFCLIHIGYSFIHCLKEKEQF